MGAKVSRYIEEEKYARRVDILDEIDDSLDELDPLRIETSGETRKRLIQMATLIVAKIEKLDAEAR